METATFSYTPLPQGSHFEEYAPDEAQLEGDEDAEQLEGFFGTVSCYEISSLGNPSNINAASFAKCACVCAQS